MTVVATNLAPWKSQWSTLFAAVVGPRPFDESEVLGHFGRFFKQWFTSNQWPSMETIRLRYRPTDYDPEYYEVAGGPYDGAEFAEDRPPYLTAIKWNLRTSTRKAVTPELLSDLRRKWRASRPDLGPFHVETWSLKSAGDKLSGDRGIPRTPALPPRPLGPVVASSPAIAVRPSGLGWWWLALAAGGAVALAASDGRRA